MLIINIFVYMQFAYFWGARASPNRVSVQYACIEGLILAVLPEK